MIADLLLLIGAIALLLLAGRIDVLAGVLAGISEILAILFVVQPIRREAAKEERHKGG